MIKVENSIKAKEGELEKKITDLLSKMGMPRNLDGFSYVRRAIIIVIERNMESEACITKVSLSKFLYPTLAKIFETTSSRVERSIRHSIEVSWDRGDVEYLNSLFGTTISRYKGKPTNSEFISFIADKVRLELK